MRLKAMPLVSHRALSLHRICVQCRNHCQQQQRSRVKETVGNVQNGVLRQSWRTGAICLVQRAAGTRSRHQATFETDLVQLSGSAVWCSGEILTARDLRQLAQGGDRLQRVGVLLGGQSLRVPRLDLFLGSWDATLEYAAQGDDCDRTKQADLIVHVQNSLMKKGC